MPQNIAAPDKSAWSNHMINPSLEKKMGQTASKTTELKEATLTGVVATGEELGRGAYGRVFKVQHHSKEYAAKEIHPLLLEDRSDNEKKAIEEKFVKECLCCKKIKHSNIVEFKGVYFDSKDSVFYQAFAIIFGRKQSINPPTMVMELMKTSLKLFIEENESKIKNKTKMSILCDVCEGLSFLHNDMDPPIIHRDLTSGNIMLTSDLVAKIGDLGVARVLSTDSAESRNTLTRAPGTIDFMPPEALYEHPQYGTAVDVFSFSAISLHIFSEQWPTPSAPKKTNPITDEVVAFTEAERRHTAKLRKLMERCLSDNPSKCPPIEEVTQKLVSILGPLQCCMMISLNVLYICKKCFNRTS